MNACQSGSWFVSVLLAAMAASGCSGAAAAPHVEEASLGGAHGGLAAAPLSDSGACPTFHCSPEATGAMGLPLEAPAYSSHWQNASAGTLVGQGCSGNGTILACLFSDDTSGSGTLKVFDPIAKVETWASRQVGSFDLSSRAAKGQVPYITASGDILAADDRNVVRYGADGKARATLPLTGSGRSISFGVLGLSGTTALVNQQNGALTAFDIDTLASHGALQVQAPNGAALNIVSPASAHEARAYLVTKEPGRGLTNAYLATVDAGATGLAQRWSYAYQGESGASAVVVAPAVSGRARPLVLVHTPAPAGATRRSDRLTAIEDEGDNYRVAWSVPLDAPMDVSPLVDPVARVLYVRSRGQATVQSYDFDGTLVASTDLRTLAPPGYDWGDFVLSGHLAGTFAAGERTVLLSGRSAAGHFVMGFDPARRTLRWATRTVIDDRYTAAWTIQIRPGGNCPIFIGSGSGINVLCP